MGIPLSVLEKNNTGSDKREIYQITNGKRKGKAETSVNTFVQTLYCWVCTTGIPLSQFIEERNCCVQKWSRCRPWADCSRPRFRCQKKRQHVSQGSVHTKSIHWTLFDNFGVLPFSSDTFWRCPVSEWHLRWDGPTWSNSSTCSALVLLIISNIISVTFPKFCQAPQVSVV